MEGEEALYNFLFPIALRGTVGAGFLIGFFTPVFYAVMAHIPNRLTLIGLFGSISVPVWLVTIGTALVARNAFRCGKTTVALALLLIALPSDFALAWELS